MNAVAIAGRVGRPHWIPCGAGAGRRGPGPSRVGEGERVSIESQKGTCRSHTYYKHPHTDIYGLKFRWQGQPNPLSIQLQLVKRAVKVAGWAWVIIHLYDTAQKLYCCLGVQLSITVFFVDSCHWPQMHWFLIIFMFWLFYDFLLIWFFFFSFFLVLAEKDYDYNLSYNHPDNYCHHFGDPVVVISAPVSFTTPILVIIIYSNFISIFI